MMKALLYLSLILLPLLAVVEGGLNVGGHTHLGGQTPIKDVADKNVVEIAKYAISEHNKQSKENLVFEEVVQGTTQVVSGTKYDLIIAAKNGEGTTKKYEAVVVEKLWLRSKKLESFKAV